MKKYFSSLIITAIIGISFFAITAPVHAQEGVCSITSARFDKNGFLPGLLKKTGNTVTKEPVKLTITTENCVGKHLRIVGTTRSSSELFTSAGVMATAASLFETYAQLLYTGPALIYGTIAEGDVEAFDKNGIIADSNPVWLSFLANERPCETASGADCIVSVEVYNLTDGISDPIYDSYKEEKQQAILSYECINDSDGTNEAGLFGNICSSHAEVFEGGQVGEFFGNRGSWDFLGKSPNLKSATFGGDIIEDVTEFNTDSPCYDNDPNSLTYGGYKPGCNALLAPLPGLSLIDSTVTLGTYINTIVRLAIGLIVVFAVVMLVSYGFQYMTQGSITGKANAKEKIQNALIGVLIALGVFVILATINPNLLNLEPNIEEVSVSLQEISAGEFQAITGELPPTSAEVDALSRTVAKELGIPYCVFPAIFSTESQGKAGVIGHDENVKLSTRSDIPARKKFLNSGIKFNGETFTKNDDKITNNDGTKTQPLKPNDPGLGLDWRFSHGIGLTQFTFFPTVSGNEPNANAPTPTRNVIGFGAITPKQAFDPETNLRAGGTVYKTYLQICNNDIRAAFDAYGDGSCDKRPDNGSGRNPAKKYAVYQTCVAQFGTGS